MSSYSRQGIGSPWRQKIEEENQEVLHFESKYQTSILKKGYRFACGRRKKAKRRSVPLRDRKYYLEYHLGIPPIYREYYRLPRRDLNFCQGCFNSSEIQFEILNLTVKR